MNRRLESFAMILSFWTMEAFVTITAIAAWGIMKGVMK